MINLFAQIPIPRRHNHDFVARQGRWLSWSPDGVRLIQRNLDRILALPVPTRISVRGCSPYNDTYTYRLSALPDALVRFALDASEALLRTRIGRKMRFFSGMFNKPLSAPVFHKCLALIRAGVVRLNHDPRSALHAPVQPERADAGFPLHSDLFLTDRLWLVFDDVPEGESGKALFLPRDAFDVAVRSNSLIPSATRRRLLTLMNGKIQGDSFDEFYDLVYLDKPWTRSLSAAMTSNSWAIKFRSGEGYLLNDRRWLHGRTPVKGRVSSTRFRRLVYGTIRA